MLWHGTAARIIRAQRSMIEAFKYVVSRYKYNVGKTCKYMQKTIQSLTAAGGNDEQYFDGMYKAFTDTHVLRLNQEIQVWKMWLRLILIPKNKPHILLYYRKHTSYTNI